MKYAYLRTQKNDWTSSMEVTEKNNFCVILAGGRGQRLWPASRENYPKQFMDLFGTGRTMLQMTYDRFVKILPKENIYICSCKSYLDLLKEQLPELTEENILLEPVHRNTAPSVAWATMRILRRDPQANIIVTPSDQLVLNLDSFYHSISVGLGYVTENNVLLAMGVKPTRPEPGYGYIQLGDLSCKPEVFKVKSFTEKPERDFAKMFMESGEFYWNTGVFLSNARHLIHSFEKIFPLVLRNLKVEMEDCRNNIIKLPKGRLGVFNGLEGYIVVEKDNVLMICKKGDSSALVKKYANEVAIKYGEEFV